MFVRARSCLLNCPASIVKNDARKYMLPATTRPKQDESVEYPPILDRSANSRRRRAKDILAEKIKKLETVEEKIFAMNMPRYYGWNTIRVREGQVPFDGLAHAQYVTRTHLIESKGLPACYNDLVTSEELDGLVQRMKDQIEDCIAFEQAHRIQEPLAGEYGFPPSQEQIRNVSRERGSAIVKQINRILLASLSSDYPHLFQAQIDHDPRVEAFWIVGGIEPPEAARKARAGSRFSKNRADEPIDRPMQYVGSPILQLRHELPLRQIVTPTEAENLELEVPRFQYQPQVIGYHRERRRAVIVPGFWPGDPSEFGLVSFHSRDHIETRKSSYGDTDEALTVQAIFASYSWLFTQACYQGFSTYNELTYPLTTQTIITNGEWWSFCVYQLNTVLLHSELATDNPRRNMCWMTEPMQLYEKVEDGKVCGFNEDVLKLLLKFYVNAPEERANVDMKPFLGKDVRTIADIQDDDRRQWLERTYKHLMANRPRHRLMPEIPHWQKIFMIDTKTRPLEQKRAPWQFGINVTTRRLDDHQPAYIPKCKRANPKLKKVGRWEKTYYPDVRV